jgi:hypothetical protein
VGGSSRRAGGPPGVAITPPSVSGSSAPPLPPLRPRHAKRYAPTGPRARVGRRSRPRWPCSPSVINEAKAGKAQPSRPVELGFAFDLGGLAPATTPAHGSGGVATDGSEKGRCVAGLLEYKKSLPHCCGVAFAQLRPVRTGGAGACGGWATHRSRPGWSSAGLAMILETCGPAPAGYCSRMIRT